jgi:hypothetical protein
MVVLFLRLLSNTRGHIFAGRDDSVFRWTYAGASRFAVNSGLQNRLIRAFAISATRVNGFEGVGYRSVEFDASDRASGMYFYRMQARNFLSVRKVVGLK